MDIVVSIKFVFKICRSEKLNCFQMLRKLTVRIYYSDVGNKHNFNAFSKSSKNIAYFIYLFVTRKSRKCFYVTHRSEPSI